MTEEAEFQERRVAQRRRGYGEVAQGVGGNGNSKWLMGIVAALFGGVLLGWYNDIRELRPDVAVLKSEMRVLTEQVRVTNQRLEALTSVIAEQNAREARPRSER